MKHLFKCIIIFMSLWFATSSLAQATEIRIKNISMDDYEDLEIAGLKFDLLKSGQITDYKPVKNIYRYESLVLKINGETYGLHGRDYVGESPLGEGCFTCLVGLASNAKKREKFEGFDGVSANANQDEFIDERGGLSIKVLKENCPTK